MIQEAFNKLKKQILKPTNVENEWKPEIKIQSTVDMGKGMTNIERKIHVYNSVKDLVK